jgi:3-phosphoglycerate kinase
MIYSKLQTWNIHNKRVFLRADLNAPLQDTTILNNFRLTSILPTLDYLLKNNNTVILATHIGQPKDHEKNLSSELLIPWFKERNYNIIFAPDPLTAKKLPSTPQHIILLENLRFFSGEKDGDPFFAKQLAQTAEYYVNDAFGALHRNDCSITLLPYEFDKNKRTIGFLIEKELRTLSILGDNPKKPFIAILGGKKIEDKIPLIKGLLTTADFILLCPALCFSFVAALGKNVGISLINTNTFSICKKIIKNAHDRHVNLIFPIDYQIADKSTEGPLSYCDSSDFPANAFGIAIGPKTIDMFTEKINAAHTIFFNCAMGFSDNSQTEQSTIILLKAIAASSAKTIVAGGDTVTMAFNAGVEKSIDHISTGGGAALTFISGNQLPGLIPFEEE